MSIQKILCAVDFSEPSKRALEAAADLAKRYDATLTLLHVFQVPGYVLPDGMLLSAAMAADHFQAINKLLADDQRAAEKAGAPRVETLSLEGVAWREIVLRALEHHYGLIVVGTHGRTGIRHVLLGSVAERVVRHAPCPVLVVRPPT